MKHFLITSLFALSVCHAAYAETGTALKADMMRAEPFADAKSVANFVKGDKLEILNKKGAWLEVQKSGKKGWVRLLSVKRGQSTGNGLSGAVEVASGRAGTGKVVSTTGIRGLSAEELKAAKFNEDEMKKLESLTSSKENGQQFANSGGLSANKIAY